MAGKRSRLGPQPSDVLRRIRELTLPILANLCNGQPAVLYIDKFRNYCTETWGSCCCHHDRSIGKEVLTLHKEGHMRRLGVLVRVLLIVQQLLQVNRHGSKKDIYITCTPLFSKVSIGNRLVMGWLRFSEAGRKIDCINSPNTSYPVPVHVEDIEVVEKESGVTFLEKACDFNHVAT